MRSGWVFKSALCLMVCVFWAFPALSQANLIESQAYFEDPSGELTFHQVRHERFTPYTGVLTKGYGGSVYWLRLRIDPQTQTQNHSIQSGGFPPAIHTPSGKTDALVLRVRPLYLDEVELFDPAFDHTVESRKRRVTGNAYVWSESEFPSVNHGFVLPAGEAARDCFCRLK